MGLDVDEGRKEDSVVRRRNGKKSGKDFDQSKQLTPAVINSI